MENGFIIPLELILTVMWDSESNQYTKIQKNCSSHRNTYNLFPKSPHFLMPFHYLPKNFLLLEKKINDLLKKMPYEPSLSPNC